MRVGLLGSFWVSVGDRTIEDKEWSLKKAKSLVKLLALSPRHRLHREQVLDLLWPDLDAEAAANNLHRTLHAARNALGTASGASCLRLRGEMLALSSRGELWVDVEAFEEAAAAARRVRDPGSYRAALDVYAGDLLPEDPYEDWAEPRREELRSAYLSLLLGLSAAHEEREEYGSAIEAARKIVAVEPTHEEANVVLMRLLAHCGQRQAALRGYERFMDALAEVGAAPGEAGRKLYDDIFAERFPPLEAAPADPPPAPVSASLHNLPGALTSFVGRDLEIVEVRRASSMARLLTLTGAGGSGKTRLALEAARDLLGLYPDGVWLVELAPLPERSLVLQEVARVLDVREEPGVALADALVDALRSRTLLLLLDNCEHLVDEVARLAETLLSHCPGVRILATSREALGIAGEIQRPVPPLALPDPKPSLTMEELLEAESARLFMERATYRGAAFAPANAEAIAKICRRLDGIPLAIELAAARLGALSAEQISERLEHSLGLLVGGSRTATPRQRTLEGALDWGHDLLEEPEKELLARLSVFAGGWTLEAAETVGAGGGIGEGDVLDLLSGLVDKSLVVAEPAPQAGALRYRMLEPIRQYAQAKLEASGETGAVRRRHVSFFLALAEEAEPRLKGPEQEAWLDRLETEHDNLRAALRWTLEQEKDGVAPRLAGALGEFWTVRGYLNEGRRWLKAALANGRTTSARIDKVLFWSGLMASEQGDYEEAEVFGEESLRLARDLGDKANVANVLYNLGLMALFRNSYEQSSAWLEEAVALRRELGDSAGLALAIQVLGSAAIAHGDHDRAAVLNEEALALAREAADPVAIIFALASGALAASVRGDREEARRLRTEGMLLAMKIGHERLIVHYLHLCAVQAGVEGRLIRAATLWGAADAVREAIGAAVSPLEEHFFGPYIAAVHHGLDERTREAAWAEGRAMTRDEATRYALSEEGPPAPPPAVPLSLREREVARLVADGFTNRRIAEALGLSRRTADTHVSRILRKLGLESREQVAAWVRDHLRQEML